MRLATHRLSIRAQLTVLTIVAVAPGIAMWFWHLGQSWDAALELAASQARVTAGQVAADVSGSVRDAELALAHFVERPAVKAMDPDNCDPIIRQIKDIRPHVEALTTRDRQRRLVCTSLPTADYEMQGSATTLYDERLAAGTFFVTGPLFRGDPQNPPRWISTLIYPIRDDAGEVAGLTLLSLSLQRWSSAVLSKTPPASVVEVLDLQGRVVFRSKNPSQWIGSEATGARLRKLEGGAADGRWLHAHDFEHTPRLWVSEVVPDIGWVVWVGVSETEVLEPVRARQNFALLLGGILFIGCLALSGGIGSGIVRSIDRLAVRARQICDADFTGRFAAGGPLEVGNVISSFNGLLDAFERQRKERDAILANLPGVAFRIRCDEGGKGRLVFVSEGIYQLLGYRPEELIGDESALGALVPPDEIEDIVLVRHQMLETGFAERFGRAVAKDGSEKWISSRQKITHRDETSFTYDGLLIDVTELVRMQEQLQASEADMKRILFALNLASDGFCVVNPRGRIQYVNNALAEMLGIDPTFSQLGLSWNKLLWSHAITRSGETDRPATGSGSGALMSEHIIWRRPDDNREIHLDVRTRRLPQGGQVATITDVTTEVLSKERDDANRAKVEHSRRLESLGQMASGIAHDFNNLIGAINGFSKFILDDSSPDSSQHRFARRILDAGNRAKALVTQILSFTHRQNVPMEAILLEEVIENSLELLRAILPATTLLECDIEDEDLRIAANSDLLGQLLVNLCVNASDALEGEQGAVSVDVRITPMERAAITDLAGRTEETAGAFVTWADQDGWRAGCFGAIRPGEGLVSIFIRDKGIGMTPDVLDRLFEPFFTTKRRGSGTGLGLPMAHGILLAHHGAMLVRTKQGEGTEFEVILPLAKEATKIMAEPKQADTKNDAAKDTGTGQKATILLVDDNRDFADMLATFLERLGCEVAVCEEPKVALEALTDNPESFDLLITDQSMPDMKGTELVSRALAIRPNLPCIVCTGYVTASTDKAVTASGARGLLRKPLNFAETKATVEACLAWGRSKSLGG